MVLRNLTGQACSDKNGHHFAKQIQSGKGRIRAMKTELNSLLDIGGLVYEIVVF